jgi:hypothetical protein
MNHNVKERGIIIKNKNKRSIEKIKKKKKMWKTEKENQVGKERKT